MLEFAVVLEGENVGRWVLAVDAARNLFLIVNGDKSLQWVPMADCTFLKARNPDRPTPVLVAQPEESQIVVPHVQVKSGPNGSQK